jgi:hypothetical protein
MRNIKVEEPRAFREIREEVTVEIAIKCLKRNIPVETIAYVTDLTVAQLQELQDQVSRRGTIAPLQVGQVWTEGHHRDSSRDQQRIFTRMDRTKHQTYEPWGIGLFPKGPSDVWSLSDSREGLEIDLIFHDADQLVTVKFGDTDAYRVIDEGYRLRQLQHLPLPMEQTI